MKKVLSVLLAVFLMISILPTNLFSITASAATSGTTGDCHWTLDGTTLTISGNGATWNYSNCTNNDDHTYTNSYDTTCNVCNCVRSVDTYTGTYQKLTYEISPDANGGSVTITKCDTSASGTVTVPSTISGAPVTKINERAFFNCINISELSLPFLKTEIGKLFSYGLDNKDSLPSSLKKITIRGGTIPGNAFKDAVNISSVVIGDSVTAIGPGAFEDCVQLVSVKIGNKVTSIGAGAFSGCKTLMDITFGKKVQTIGGSAFSNCESIEKITLPSTVTELGQFAFGYCKSLTQISLGNNLKTIGEGAFTQCENLTSIVIPRSVTRLDASVFEYCEKLKKAIIRGKIEQLNINLFKDCSNLSLVALPKDIRIISNGAFYQCDLLKEVWYESTSATRKTIKIAANNDLFKSAQWHYGEFNPDGHVYAAATCLSPKKCKICGVTSGGKVGHTYFNACDKTCNVCKATRKVGAHKYTNNCDTTCNICKAKRTIKHTYSNACDKICNVCKTTRKVSAHKYSNACDKTCNVCKATRKVGAHKYTNNCDTTCNICKAKRSIKHKYTNTCDTTCNICKTKRIIKHTYSSACDKTCNVCKATRKVPPHKYSNACDKTCNVCKATRKVPTHKYSNKCDATCNVCKAKRTIKHKYSNACDANCNICKAKRKAPHKYSNNCDTNCNICKAKRTIKHTYSNACDKSCNVCKATRKVSAHKYSNACDKTCNICKAIRKVSAHKYSNKCDTTCNICKATRKITHSYKTTTTKATLAKNGSVVKKCTVCKKVASTTTIKYAKVFKLSTTSYTYDGKVKTPSVVVKDSSGKTLKKNTDYTVTYASGRKNAGTYKVTVTMKGNYSGAKNLYFNIEKYTDEQQFKKYCKYTISNKQVIIEKLDFWESGNLIIPAKVDGYPVTKIKSGAFYNNQATSLTIPASVTNIEIDTEYGFGGPCLENVYVDSANKHYSSDGGVLFNKDKTELLCYPEGKKQTAYTIPSTVKKIKSGAFQLSEIKSLTIPNNVTHIESGAISWCHSLESVNIGSGVNSIDTTWGVFEGCSSLKQILVSDNNKYFTSVNGVLFNKDKTKLVRYPSGKTNNTYTVPSTVTTIGSNAFDRCENLTSVVLGENVSLIDWNAFYSCYNLKSITFGIGIKTVNDAFHFCESLTDVYYKGTKVQKEEIDFGFVVQEELNSATWHYNC